MLEDAGMGASLQHYNPLIDDEVRKAWNLPGDWKLVAQMPFGVPVAQPGSKEVMSLDERVLNLLIKIHVSSFGLLGEIIIFVCNKIKMCYEKIIIPSP